MSKEYIEINPVILFDGLSDGEVVFHPYIESDEDQVDIYFSDIWTKHIVGLEQKDGSVIVYKNSTKISKPLRNKQIFMKKYFIEAL